MLSLPAMRAPPLRRALEIASGRSQRGADAAPRTTLVQRLKDCALQRQWAAAVGLFDRSSEELKRTKWRPFHYAALLQVLRDSRKPECAARVWDFMLRHPDQTMDEQSLSEALALAVATRQPALVQSVQQQLSERGLADRVRPFAQRYFLRHTAQQWESALASLSALRSAASSIDAVNAVLDYCGSPTVARATIEALPDVALAPNDATFAALVRCYRRQGDWEQALGVVRWADTLAPRATAATIGPLSCAQVLGALASGGRLEQCEAVVVAMRDRQIPHTQEVVEAVVGCFHARSKSDRPEWRRGAWHEALSYVTAMRYLNVKGTLRGYTALIRMYRDRGVNDGGAIARRLDEAMKADGVAADARTSIQLIHAWSNQQRTRNRFR